MTLEDDLAAWVAERHDWQKDVVGRFCRNESLTDEDIDTIADHLVAGTYPAITAPSAGVFPGTSASGDPVTLRAIADVQGVNALVSGQRLTFGDAGLTIVYGDNASGKSGYARLIRQAVTARVKGDILGDVFARNHRDQTASVEYVVGSSAATWTLADEPAHDLSLVRFYDEECGESYVTVASEIGYRPSALTLLDRLSGVCDRVQQAIAARLAANAGERPDLPLLADGTKARRFLDALDAATTQSQIDEVTQLDEDHEVVLSASLKELARLQASDPSAEKIRLARLASGWTTVHSHVEKVAVATSAIAIAEIASSKQRAIDLRAAATLASTATFDGEPIDGVGTATWRALWEAARLYSTTEAYPQHHYPVVDSDAVCVLCQQSLTREGRDRLTRFETFVSDTTSRDADAAETVISQLQGSLASLSIAPPAVTAALSQLQSESEDVTDVQAWLATAEAVCSSVVAWLDGLVEALPSPPATAPSRAIEMRRTVLTDASVAIDATTFQERVRALKTEIVELQAKDQLAAAKGRLIAEVKRLKVRARIEEARRLTDTTGITRRATLLTTKYVTTIVRDQFTRETERLHLRKVTLAPTNGRRDATLEHLPRLLGATVVAAVDEVLSEGEQTALGLAGFLTEVEFDETKSAVVLDDPVSSLDAGRRSRVASRLIELALSRQVVVFTHEATFVSALNKAARDLGVDVSERTVMCLGDRPGLTSEKHPWSVRDVPARINELEAELARLKRERMHLDSVEYTRRVHEWAGHLSQAWERAVNLEIVNELVDRGTNEVRPRMFKMLVPVNERDNMDYQSGYAQVSEWVNRHDQAPEVNFTPPEPDELEGELTRFKEWVARIKGYKK